MTNIYTRYFRLISLIFLSIVIPNRQIFKSFGRTISNISSFRRPVLFEIKYFGDVSLFRNKCWEPRFHFATENGMIMKNADERYGKT